MGKVVAMKLHAYRGEWVAVDPESRRVLAHDESLESAEQQAIEQGSKYPLLFLVHDDGIFFFGLK
jgi:hypothetical protein